MNAEEILDTMLCGSSGTCLDCKLSVDQSQPGLCSEVLPLSVIFPVMQAFRKLLTYPHLRGGGVPSPFCSH